MNTALIAAFLLTASPAFAFSARVLRCHDGDTCTVDTGQGVLKIRLAEIDAPEIDQPYGIQAQRVICSMVCGRVVDIQPRGTSYDRVVGLIRINGIDTSEAMVRAGAAWDYARYDHDSVISGLEAQARGRASGTMGWIMSGSAVGLAAGVQMIVTTTPPLQTSS